jgi:hypothetical protein
MGGLMRKEHYSLGLSSSMTGCLVDPAALNEAIAGTAGACMQAV